MSKRVTKEQALEEAAELVNFLAFHFRGQMGEMVLADMEEKAARWSSIVEQQEAKPAVQGEPVAIYKGHRSTPQGTKEFWGFADNPLPADTKLYAAPQPAEKEKPNV